MNLIKVKGIIIKESSYKENDKIVTILTDELGKITAISRGSKKSNSSLLACSQYLVYSEFVLYKNKNFYYVNSGNIINMFYKFRIDFDKMEIAFEATKIINNVTDENQDTSKILKLLLNTVYILENSGKDKKLVVAAFKIKLFSLIGFTPKLDICVKCGQALSECENIFYDYVSNVFLCGKCINRADNRRYISVSKSTLIAIRFIIKSDIKKIFSFELKELNNFDLFGQVYCDTMINGI